MKYSEEFVAQLEKEIKNNLHKIFTDKDALDRVSRLMSIHANIVVEQTHVGQLEVLRQSNEIAKNIDFSKLDLNQLLSNIRGG